MPVPAKINNHFDQIEEAFPVQFKDKPNIYALLQNCTEKIQNIEDLFWSIFENTQFYKAKGVNLDRYGFMLNKKRPAGMSDEEYFILLAGEIIIRSSDGTVDGIRKRIEAVLNLFKSNIVLVNNTLNWRTLGTYPDLTGSIYFYGYTRDLTRRLTGLEGNILKAACPVTTSVAIFGQHVSYRSLRISNSSLFIPCEIITQPDQLVVQDPGPTLDELSTDAIGTDVFALRGSEFKMFGKNWENARLAEQGSFAEEALIDLVDAEDYLEVDGISANPASFGQEFTDVLLLESEGWSADRGILLEISVST